MNICISSIVSFQAVEVLFLVMVTGHQYPLSLLEIQKNSPRESSKHISFSWPFQIAPETIVLSASPLPHKKCNSLLVNFYPIIN